MPGLTYRNVDPRQLAVAVRTRGGWWHWRLGAWTSPFVAGDHALPCERDRDLPVIQAAEIADAALVPGASVIDGILGPGGDFTPANALNAPSNYVDVYLPARGVLASRP